MQIHVDSKGNVALDAVDADQNHRYLNCILCHIIFAVFIQKFSVLDVLFAALD